MRQKVKEYLERSSSNEASGLALWKATRELNRPSETKGIIEMAEIVKKKANTFANYLADTFQPYPSSLTTDKKKTK